MTLYGTAHLQDKTRVARSCELPASRLRVTRKLPASGLQLAKALF